MTAECTILTYKPASLDHAVFRRLHPEGRRLITAWAKRGAGVAPDADASAYFEGFIYLWFALNGWGACTTGVDLDREWVARVAADKELDRLFQEAVRANHGFAGLACRFRSLWPIFKSSEIRRRGIKVPHGATRRQRIDLYLKNNIPYEPCCFRDHRGKDLPLDWPHTLKTLYRVRNNLFHGEKALDSENDRRIVQAAYPLLVQALRLVEVIS